MPRITFLADFMWHTPGTGTAQTTAYRKGSTRLVTTPCAEAAIAKGLAIKAKGKGPMREARDDDAGRNAS